MKVTIFGDSHAAQLKFSADVLDGAHETEFSATNGQNWLDPHVATQDDGIRVYCHKVENTPPLDMVLRPGGRLYFSSPLHTGPFTRAPAWRTYCPWSVHSAHPGLVPLSDSALLTWVGRDLEPRLRFLSLLRDNGFDVRVIEAPRPLARTPALFQIHPDVLRCVDRICRSYVMTRLHEIGVPVIAVPDATVADGFTRDDFSHANPKDPHHGNRAFGRLMMQHIGADLRAAG